MINYKNYPLRKGNIRLNEDELLMYVNIFTDHKMTKINENNNHIATIHIFIDKLSIKILWRIINKNLFFFSMVNSIDDLMYLRERNILSVSKIDIITYSKPQFVPSPEVEEKFRFVFNHNLEHTLNHVSYEELEFNVSKPTTLDDTFFETLIQRSNNIIAFEKFLKDKNNNKDSVF